MDQQPRAFSPEETEMWRRIIDERPTQKEKMMVYMFDERLRDAFYDDFQKVAAYMAYSYVMDGISDRCDEIGDRTQFELDARRLGIAHPRQLEFLDIYVGEYWKRTLRSPFPPNYQRCNFVAGEKITKFLRENRQSNALLPKHIKVGIPQKNRQDFQQDQRFYPDLPAGTEADLNEIANELPATDQNRETLLQRVGADMHELSVEIFLEYVAQLAQLQNSLPNLIRKCRNIVSLEMRWCRDVNQMNAAAIRPFEYQMPKLRNLRRLKITTNDDCPIEWFNYRRYFRQLEELEISFTQRNHTLDQQGIFPKLKTLVINTVGFVQFQPLRESVQRLLEGLDIPRLNQLVLNGLAFEGNQDAENDYIRPIIETGTRYFQQRHQPEQENWNFVVTHDAQANECTLTFNKLN